MGRPVSIAIPALAALALSACTTAHGDARANAPRDQAALLDPPLADALEAAVRSHDLAAFDLTDAALIASGFERRSTLRSARARLEQLVAPILDPLNAIADPKERGRRLLASLHQKGGLLGEYDARATTLGDVLDRRRYNCVSASVLYNVLAARIGLDVSAQLLPTHARSRLTVPHAPGEPKGAAASAKTLTVETTSPDGFDPDSRKEASILAQVGGSLADGGRPLVPDRGSIVSTLVLIGAIYVNRASIAQEGGDLGSAERLFAHGEAFAVSEEMRRILRDQRAALLSQLGADDVISEDASRLERAYRTLKSAVALDPKEALIRATVFQNLRAAAERVIHQDAEKGDEAALLARAGEAASLAIDPAERSGLRAFALSEVVRIRINKGDLEGAVKAIDLALKEQLGPKDADLQKALEQNRISALRLAALDAAKKGDYPRATELIGRIQHLRDLTPEQRRETDHDHLRVIHLVGNKRIEANDFKGAAEVYREGVRRFPDDATCKSNLVAVLERLALPLLGRAACSEADQFLEEIRMLSPSSRFASTARVRCLMDRAQERLDAKDYPEAVSLMRAARETSPSEPAVVGNLAIALLRWTSSLSANGSCVRAATLAQEIRGLPTKVVAATDLKRALAPCHD